MAKSARSKAEQISALFKILADKNRCSAIMVLSRTKRGMPVNDLAKEIDMSQSAMSHLLSSLYDEDVVSSKRDGRVVVYALASSPTAKVLLRLLKAVRG